MLVLEKDRLVFHFPETHEHAKVSIDFQRTLRIPDDNRHYPLPPGLGRFPLDHVEDHVQKLPQDWSKRGGVFLPMYQSEALWINFSGSYPIAIKVAAGKINAVTGNPWDNELHARPQDYLTVPGQPWLDGFCVQKGAIRQFVAMPLGQGYTVEEQLTNKAEFGGLQIIAYPMKADRYEEIRKRTSALRSFGNYSSQFSGDGQIFCATASVGSSSNATSMGMAPGSLMRQEIFADKYGIDAWDTNNSSRCFIHLVNSEQYMAITGQQPPTQPPNASDYVRAGLPWYDFYGGDLQALGGSQKLAKMHSVGAMQVQKGESIIKDPICHDPKNVLKISSDKSAVKDGLW